jgi:glycosyltransferase involved in cell wall biosynthesis
LGSLAVLAYAGLVRCRRGGVYWTVHNLRPHDEVSDAAARCFYAAWTRLVTGTIHLSAIARASALETHPRLAAKPSVIAPHGPYPCTRTADAGRAASSPSLVGRLAVDADVVFVGQVRNYKGVLPLVAVSRDIGARLLVAGHCPDPQLSAQLSAAAGEAPDRLVLHLHHLSEDEMEDVLHAGALVALPYLRILNSGSVLLALSHSARVLAPKIGSVAELAENLDSELVRTYTPPLTADTLRQALATNDPSDGKWAKLRAAINDGPLSWRHAAEQHRILFHSTKGAA